MFGSLTLRYGLLLALIAGQYQVSGQQCGSVVITSQADADALRSCPEIFGHVTIRTDASIPAIELEGVKAIHGDLVNDSQCGWVMAQCIGFNHNITSISSSTLMRVNGSVILRNDGWITSLSFPELKSVGGHFFIRSLESLRFLDVDLLDSVGYVGLMSAPRLTTLKLGACRDITGITYPDGSIDRSMDIGLGGLESLDAFFQKPQLSVDRAHIQNASKVKRLQIGAAKIGTLDFDWVAVGEPSNFTLVLGGSGVTEQIIGNIETTHSLSSIERLPNLKILSVGSYSSLGGNFYKHLDLPFDHLGNLTIVNERDLVWLSVPPQAAQWENFGLLFRSNDNLNLSTEYRVSENGEMIRSWFWPQPGMGFVSMTGNFSNLFFDSYFQFRNTLSGQAFYNRTEDLKLRAGGPFSREPFEKLYKKIRRQHLSCYAQDPIDLDSGGPVQAKPLAFGWIVAGAIVTLGIALV